MEKKIKNLKSISEIFFQKNKQTQDPTKPVIKKYNIGERVIDNGLFECSNCGDIFAVMGGEILPACDFCNAENKLNYWSRREEKVRFVSRNPNIIFERRSSLIEKLADKITIFAGSMLFVFLHIIWFSIWIAVNLNFTVYQSFDPFPFGLLTMIVSLEAIILSTFVLISQNRITERSEVRSDLDYKVNLNSEKMITEAIGLLRDIKENVEDKTKE